MVKACAGRPCLINNGFAAEIGNAAALVRMLQFARGRHQAAMHDFFRAPAGAAQSAKADLQGQGPESRELERVISLLDAGNKRNTESLSSGGPPTHLIFQAAGMTALRWQHPKPRMTAQEAIIRLIPQSSNGKR